MQRGDFLRETALAFLARAGDLICPRCGQMLKPESIRIHADGVMRVYHGHEKATACRLSTMERDWKGETNGEITDSIADGIGRR